MVRREEGEEEFAYPRDVVFGAVSRAVLSVPGFALVRSDRDAGEVEGTIGLSFWSAGEVVRIGVKEMAAGRSKVLLSSTSRLKTTLVDHGKNRKNIDDILGAVRGNLPGTLRGVPAGDGIHEGAVTREDLGPLEQLLARGKISRQEFGQARARILKGQEGIPCPACGALNPVAEGTCFNCGGPLGFPATLR